MKLFPIALVLTGICGCTVTTSATHTYAHGVEFQVAAGDCVPVLGPEHFPSGTTSDYSIVDLDGTDSMEAAIIDDSFNACDFSVSDGDSVGSDPGAGTGSLPSGDYDLFVACNNLVQTCDFQVTWTADY